MAWYDDLCEYYKVTKDQAVQLSTRAPGRKPSLPGSPTTHAVSGKTFENLWDEKPRDTIQQKMDFYKDIGAWQAFRQCNYNKDIGLRYAYLFKRIVLSGVLCEYGCGIAPITNHLIENHSPRAREMTFHLVDVPGEHLCFAKWRLKKKAPHTNIVFHEISEAQPVPDFGNVKFDFVTIMDVLEHVPNPLCIVETITEHMTTGGILVENWIRGHNADRENLHEAEYERPMCMAYIDDNYIRLFKEGFRIWSKNASHSIPA
jgi:2-polyprenyl-3-methyl-5-hydroxy-6-metoxy-1,4-benzoquinol methylase